MGSSASIVLSPLSSDLTKETLLEGQGPCKGQELPQGSLFLPFPSIILPISFILLNESSPHTDYPGLLQSPVLGTEGRVTMAGHQL